MNKTLFSNELYQGNTNGITPPIAGENFTIKRGYKLMPSTLRKLHEIKAGYSDINIYMNTIIDRAINHYYDNIFSILN